MRGEEGMMHMAWYWDHQGVAYWRPMEHSGVQVECKWQGFGVTGPWQGWELSVRLPGGGCGDWFTGKYAPSAVIH